MTKIQKLTKKEQNLLEQHYKHSQTALIRERAHAILLSAQGYSPVEIAGILIRKPDTIHVWIEAFQSTRVASIFPGYANNQNAAKLTQTQKEEVKKTLAIPTGEVGSLPNKFWTLPTFKEYINAKFKVVYESERSYHYLLEYAGYSFKLPSPFDLRRNEQTAQIILDKANKQAKKYLADGTWVVLVADEANVTSVTEIRRAWLKTGEKTVLKINREKVNQSYFGALNLKTGRAHTIRMPWQNQEEIIKVLHQLLSIYPNTNICIIWDNAKWHKGKLLRSQLGKGNPLERIHLVNFPPYCPDTNPQEHIWKFGKESIANITRETFEELLSAFEKNISEKIFDYKIPKFVLR